MQKFEINSPKTSVSFTLSYDNTNRLLAIIFEPHEQISPDFFTFVACNMFTTVQMLQTVKKQGYTVKECIENIDFNAFWEKYNYKFDRKRAEDKWKKLKTEEQVAAYKYIEVYQNELRRSGVAQMYAKTYLQNQVWK